MQPGGDAVLLKLGEFGIGGSLRSVIADLLSDTSARVVVNGSTSSPTESAGVRQGSILGPLLFNILLNGIADAVVKLDKLPDSVSQCHRGAKREQSQTVSASAEPVLASDFLASA